MDVLPTFGLQNKFEKVIQPWWLGGRVLDNVHTRLCSASVDRILLEACYRNQQYLPLSHYNGPATLDVCYDVTVYLWRQRNKRSLMQYMKAALRGPTIEM